MAALPASLRRLLFGDRARLQAPPATLARRLDCLEYEDRTLFSATPMGAEMLVQAAANSAQADSASATTVEAGEADSSIASAAADSSLNGSGQSANTTNGADATTEDSAPTHQSLNRLVRDELVIVDTSVGNYRQLVDDLTANADDNRKFHIVLLDPSADGIAQITDAIALYDDLSAIHFVTHASDGELRLGDARLSESNIGDYSQQMAAWRASLTDDADLLFYGCELAASDSGRALLARIEQATGADVAASTDNTGNALLGGNWRLEYTSGAIETTGPFSASMQRDWINLLNAAVDNVSSGVGNDLATLTISHTTSGSNRLMIVAIGIDPHSETVNSVTYNGTALTLIGSQQMAGNGDHSRVELWAMVAPVTGTHDVVISLSGTNNNGLVAGVITFTGVDQTTPLANFTSNSGSSTAASVTVSSQANDLVLGFVHSHHGTDVTPGAGQTEYWDLVDEGSNSSGTLAAGAASVANTWTVKNDDWTAAGVSIRSSAANSAPTLDASRTPVLGSINEDAGAPVGAVGTLVTNLVDFDSPAGQVDNVTDPDASALLGIAVTAADTTNGSWWYSTDNGSNWNALGAVADGNARLLAADANTRIYFQANANYNGTVSNGVTFRAWDQTTGTNGTLADTTTNGAATAFSVATDTAAVTVNAVNDAPVNTVPGAQSVSEDGTLVFSSGNGNPISIADGDAGSSSIQVTLTATNGTITLSGIAGLSFTAGDGTADGTMTFTGTVANINTALNGLSFTPTNNFNGAASLQIVTNDQGNTGSGGALSDTDSIAITVNAVNDAPVNSVPGAQATNEDTTLVFSSGNSNQISIADVDAAASSVQVTLTATNGTITLGGIAGLSFTAGDGTADGTMTFTGTVANINTALNGLSFIPTGGYNGAASLQIITNDQGNTGSGGAQSDTDSIAITVTAVNDAPVNTVPGAQSTNEDTALVFSSGNGNQITIADVDAGSSSVQVTLTANNGTITLSGIAGLSFTAGDGTADGMMTFTGTVANINTALNGLSFTPTNNFNGAASLQIVTNDQGNAGSGGALSDTDSIAITVNAINDAPGNTVPGAQSTNEDTTLVFSAGNGNQISIADVDAAASSVQVTLTATNGTITLSGIAGLSFTAGDGTADGMMTFTGTVANINTALNGLSFTPTNNFNGAASLQIVTNDQGNTGSGGALSDTDSIAITVNAVNDVPALTLPGTQSTPFQTALTFSIANGNALVLADVDAGSLPVRLTITPQSGTVTLAQTTGLTFLAGTGTGDSSIIVEGTLADLNAALDGLTFIPDSTFRGATSISLSIDDLGNSGGSSLVTTGHADVDVQPAAQRLQFSAPTTQAADNFHVVFSTAAGNALQFYDVYQENPILTVSISVANGTFTLASTQGLAFTSGSDGTSSMSFSGTLSDVNSALNGSQFSTTVTDSSLTINGTDPPRDGTAAQSAGGTTEVTQPPIYPSILPQSPVIETIEEIIETDGDSEEGTTVMLSPTIASPSSFVGVSAARAVRSSAEIFADPSMTSGETAESREKVVLHLASSDVDLEPRILAASQDKTTAKAGRAHLRSNAMVTDVSWSGVVFSQNGFDGASLSDNFIVGAAGVTASLSVGYVLWSIRAASLLSTMLSSMPAWQTFDPLPVINHVAARKSRSPDDDDTNDLF